jgi:ribonuclease HI
MIRLFCDSSFDPRGRQGYAAYLRVEGVDPVEPSMDDVQFAFFANTTNTRLELQGVLCALEGLADGAAVEVFTDCASLSNLLARRDRLEASKFTSRKGRALNNADLYQRVFRECDRLALQFHWLKGHKPSKERNATEQVFAFVDKAARQKLRSHVRS